MKKTNEYYIKVIEDYGCKLYHSKEEDRLAKIAITTLKRRVINAVNNLQLSIVDGKKVIEWLENCKNNI